MGKELIKPDYIFESSWEVCNKVGGIYTVLSTRAKTLQESMKDQIIFIAQTNRLAQAEEYKSMIEERFHPKAVYLLLLKHPENQNRLCTLLL